jgi:hypothetical protein
MLSAIMIIKQPGKGVKQPRNQFKKKKKKEAGKIIDVFRYPPSSKIFAYQPISIKFHTIVTFG